MDSGANSIGAASAQPAGVGGLDAPPSPAIPTAPAPGPTPGELLLGACAAKAWDYARQLLREGASPHARWTPSGETPLELALACPEPDLVESLIAAGARVEAVGSRGATALGWAAARGNVRAIEALVAAKADIARAIMLSDGQGWTGALHAAAAGGHPEAVDALIALGADPLALDDCGESAIEAAQRELTAGGARREDVARAIDRLRAELARREARRLGEDLLAAAPAAPPEGAQAPRPRRRP